MAFDAGNIFQTYMQGANFVAGSLERAEDRRRQEEADDLNRLAGKANSVFAPKYDAKGNVIPRTSVQVANDPQAIELMNDPRLKELRMQGITDPDVEDAEYVKAVDAGDGVSFIPVMRLKYKDGRVSEGPLTELRTNHPDDRLTPLDLNSTYSHIAGLVYKRNPGVATGMIQTARDNALQGLRTQYRNETDPQNREALLQTAASYGFDPAALQVQSGAPIVQQDLRTGFKRVKDAAGNVSYQRDPETAGLRGEVVAQDQKEELAKRKAFQTQDFQVEGEQRGTRQGWREEDAFLDSATKQKLADLNLERELAREGKTRRTLAEIQNEIDNTYAEAKAKRDAYHTGVVADATAGAGLRNAPTTAATRRITDPNYIPTEQEAAKIVEARQIIKDVPGLLNGGASASYQRVADLAPFLPKDERGGLRARLLAEGPRAMPALRALAEVEGGLKPEGGGKGEDPKPGEFNETGVKDWTADLPTEQKNQVRLRGRQLYEDAAKVFPTVKGSQEDTDLNMAVGEALRENLPNHVLPLVNWTQLQKNPDYAGGVGSSREFIENIHTPAVELSKQRGLSLSPNALSGVERMAVGLKARGIPDSDAVVTSIDLEKDPTRVDKIARLLPAGVTPAEREKVFLDILASDLKKDRTANAKRTLREGADYTFGGGMWR